MDLYSISTSPSKKYQRFDKSNIFKPFLLQLRSKNSLHYSVHPSLHQISIGNVIAIEENELIDVYNLIDLAMEFPYCQIKDGKLINLSYDDPYYFTSGLKFASDNYDSDINDFYNTNNLYNNIYFHGNECEFTIF